MIEFKFDRTSQRYRYKDTGKFLSKSAMKSLTKKAIDLVERDLTVVNQLLIDRKITLAAWEEQTRNGLRDLHTWQYMLGVGGEGNFTASDRGVLNNKLKKEWGYLRGFVKDINDGKVSDGQFLYRANLYVNNTDNTFDLATYKSHSRAGYKWERRRRSKDDSCGECIFYERLGWRTLGNLPNPGNECSCKANCGCYKEFSKADFIPSDAGFLSHRWGWLNATNPRTTSDNSELRLGSFTTSLSRRIGSNSVHRDG